MQKNLNIEAIKSTAVLWVVVLHVSGQLLSENLSNFGFNFWIINIVDSFSRICVPLFLLASGKFLLSKTKSLKEFYLKRASKILLPIVFWTVVYSLFGSWLQKGKLDFDYILHGIIHGRPFFHLWYLYMLIGLYAITPVLSSIIHRLSNRNLLYFSVLMIFISTGYDVIVFYFNLNIPFIFWFMSYLGYFVAGYTLDKINFKIDKKPLLIIYISTSLLIAFLTFLTIKNLHNNQYFYAASSPTVFLASLSFYLWMTKLKLSKTNYFVRISSYSFGIYLIHAFFLELMYRYEEIIHFSFLNPVFKIIIYTVLAFYGALFLSKVLVKIGLRKLIY